MNILVVVRYGAQSTRNIISTFKYVERERIRYLLNMFEYIANNRLDWI